MGRGWARKHPVEAMVPLARERMVNICSSKCREADKALSGLPAGLEIWFASGKSGIGMRDRWNALWF